MEGCWGDGGGEADDGDGVVAGLGVAQADMTLPRVSFLWCAGFGDRADPRWRSCSKGGFTADTGELNAESLLTPGDNLAITLQ